MLIPYYHVIPAFFPVASDVTIKKGQIVMLNSSGEIELADGHTSTPIGLSGDDVGTLTAGQFVNRVSDYGNDTYASGQVTVYQNGGQFFVDLLDCFVDGESFNGGNGVTNGMLLGASTATDGKFTVANASAQVYAQNGGVTDGLQLVAKVVDDLSETAGALPTGIPGEYEPSGNHEDIELNGAYNYPGGGGPARKFCRIQLLI